MKPLTNREIRLLSLLAQGRTYEQIASQYEMSLANVYTTCHHIRNKANIWHTRNKEECKRFLATLPPQRVADALTPGLFPNNPVYPLTFCQLDVFRLMAAGHSYPQIAQKLGITSQSVQNLASRACKRAGLVHSGWDRKERIREWLENNRRCTASEVPPPEPSAPADPMDDPMF